MAGRRIRRKYKIGFIMLLVFIVAYMLFWVVNHWPDPPVEEMKLAGKAVSDARIARAQVYAPALYKKSCRQYDSAMYFWKAENEHFFLNRNFFRASRYARLSEVTGKAAYKAAIDRAVNISNETVVTLAELEKKIAEFKTTFSPLPIDPAIRKDFNLAVMLISEAKLAREKSELHITEEKLLKAKAMIGHCESEVKGMLQSYFASLPKWKNMVYSAISASETNNSTVIIVEKLAHKCYIYHDGTLKRQFDAEFGPNWIGNKLYKGDKATPEGIYQVTSKKEKRKTIYYKALTLNYPNSEDRERFYNNIINGRVSRRSEVGGSIEIHGEGGRGFDWTNGCIGLENKSMDVVYSMASVSTPVVIVGSTEPLDKFLENVREKSMRN